MVPGARAASACATAMRFRILALDFDGTIATDGRVDPDVAAAIAEERAEGRVVVLVTGRILDDLRCRLGGLRAFDAVVAEEGAVLAFPQSGSSRVLAPPPSRALLAGLAARGIPARAGRCVVECDAVHSGRVLALVRELELPLVIHFNRGRMMVLPQAVSKATGLREALRSLRLSPHNAIAIGDAENDHELLAVCEVGVAVAWGSAALRQAADVVLAGTGPHDVAAWVRAASRSDELTPPAAARRRLLLGRHADGTEAHLGVRGRNVLIAGDPASGKSWLAGLLAEQLVLQGYGICVVDPEGDYGELAALPGVQVLGGSDALPSARDLTRVLAHPDASAVVDLSCARNAQKPAYVRWLLELLADMRRRTGLPHRILVDEAHYFLHEPDWAARLTGELQGCTLITYRASDLAPDVLRACEAVFVTRATDAREAQVLHRLCGGAESAEHWQRTLAELELDEAALLPGADEAAGRLVRFRIAPRLTHHVRHEHKYLDAPLAEHLAFRFAPEAGLAARPARSLREFLEILDCAGADQLDGHLARGDFSRWIEGVFHDGPLATRVRELEELHRLGRLADVNDALIQAVRARYRGLDGSVQMLQPS
jgi:hypothetical protein